MKKTTLKLTALASGLLTIPLATSAGEIGHYNGGVANIRDYVVPDPGFYGALYNYWYATDRLNDSQGNQVNSAKSGVIQDAKLDVDVYAVMPMVIWVSDWKILGAKYAAYIAPSFANSSVGASLNTVTGRGLNGSLDSEFGVGDLFVQPLWLGWSCTNWDFALGYGFYAPVGRYDTFTTTLPVAGQFTLEAGDNIGLGYWTHQIQGASSWYPWADKRMAVSGALTYEINQQKEDFDLTAGQRLTFNWGISQYVPLKKDQTLLLEVGPAGYDSWQITDDTGSAARNPSVHDQVHGVGGQLGLTYVPWMLSVNFHGFYEFYSTDRFQGHALGLNIAKKF